MARLYKTMYYENPLKENAPAHYSIVNIFSTDGRIGRQAYFVYSIVLPFLLFWVLGSIAGLVSKLGNFAAIASYAILTLAVIVILFTLVRLTIQRCHDFNASAILAFLALIPFASLIFSLIPGDAGLNSYGEAPQPTTKFITISVKVIVSIAVFIMALVAMKVFGLNLKDLLA